MYHARPIHVGLAFAVVLSGCVSTSEPGTNGGTEQLRASQRSALRQAGVSDACIDSLDRVTLTQVKGITDNSARSSRQWIQNRQRIRTAAARACPTL